MRQLWLRPQKRNVKRTAEMEARKESHRSRSVFLVLCIFFAFMGMGGRLAYVGFAPVEEPEARLNRTPQEVPVRGNIYDRNGVLLATTLKVKSLYADPKMMLDVDDALLRLATVLPDLNYEKINARVASKKRRFVWLKRQLTPQQVKEVNDLGIPGLSFRDEYARVYPHKNLLAHALGHVSVDGKGMAGVEASNDDVLNAGEDVYLTVDVRVQRQLRTSLLENIERTEAKSSWGVVTDPNTAEILAMVSLPDFDPNDFGAAAQESWLNKAVYGAYEMGSTFKIFTMAEGVDEGFVHEETPLDVTRPLRIGRFTIRDFHPKYKVMTMKEAFRRSSNVGTARVADMFAGEAQEAFFSKLNLLRPVDIGVKEIGRPITPKRWGRIQTMTMSYGHGIAVTAVQMMGAVGSVVSDGTYKTPHIVQGFETPEPHTVIKPETVQVVRSLMRDVVQEGTARRAKMEGFDVGGKTGTSEKAVAGGYSKDKNIASFIGAVPMRDPELLVLVMVDEPKKPNDGGGTAAAPAFKRFVQRVAPMIGMRPELNPMMIDSFEIRKASYNAPIGTSW